ncbi:MAG: DUF2461 domain-containing protein [Cyclobacteriaceae bacterium]|nr:DUF2461 domain-containing protein [Cyclobacteriaceae bacterium HetDA_MAG_MS6]
MKNVLSFLSDLTAHNNRDWMTENKSRYQEARKEFSALIANLITGISVFDPGIGDLEPKDCLFRINRDVRFSKDKSPYKTNFGAAMTEGGRHSPNPTYYLHVQPGHSFLAGGMYMPQPENLKKIRQEIDYNPEELKKIVGKKAFKQVFGEITGDRLKTAPKGYPKDHPNIELLQLKSFIVMHNLDDAELESDDFAESVISKFKVMHPFNEYLSVAIS